MALTNEFAGRLILLGIIVICFVAICIFGMMLLKINYKWRKHGIRYYQNSIYYSVVLIFVWILTAIPNLLDKFVIGKLFNKSLKDGISVFQFTVVSVIIAYMTYYLCEKIAKSRFHVPLKYALLLLTIAGIYWSIRIDGSHEFYPVFKGEHWADVGILDLPALLYTGFTFCLLFHSLLERKKEHTYQELIMADSPLGSIDDDQYSRKKFYKSSIETIKNSAANPKKSLSIGIVNRWGEGKTSFLKFIKDDLKDDNNTIVIEFNPWYSTNANNLTLDFFQTLDHEISKYVYTGSIIRQYAKSLTNINSVFNPFKYLPDKWIGEKSNRQYFEDINNLINKLDKRIIVFIDDLDRLDNKEVFSVFQVIRNSADFSNTIFIVPFDKDYVIKSLTENKIPKPDEYIKKMFDVEIALPAISKRYLINVFKHHFKSILKKLVNLTGEDEKKFVEQIEKIISDSGSELFKTPKYSVLSKFLFDHIKNRRDLIRYANSLMASLRDSHNIIYLPDLMILEMIKYLNKDVYRKLFENRDYLIPKIEEGSVVSTFVLFEKKPEPDRKENFSERVLQATVYDYDIRIDDVTKERIDVADLIEELFKKPIDNDFRQKYSIIYASNYEVYHQLNEEGITQEGIDSLFE